MIAVCLTPWNSRSHWLCLRECSSTACVPGPRTLVLPRACDILDLFEGGKRIARAAREFTVMLPQSQTGLFRLPEPDGGKGP